MAKFYEPGKIADVTKAVIKKPTKLITAPIKASVKSGKQAVSLMKDPADALLGENIRQSSLYKYIQNC